MRKVSHDRQKYQLLVAAAVAVSKEMFSNGLRLELASSVVMLTTGQRIAPRLTQHQGPAQTLNTVGLTTQLSLAKVDRELSQVLTPQQNPSDLLGLAFKK